MPRSQNRAANALRPVTITPNASRHAEGSCVIAFGHTRVHVTASVDEFVPPFLRNTGSGWVTAEYGMLPRATNSRNPREAAKGKQSGRTQEIQRLIGRSLRAAIDLKLLGERQIIIDCDVLEADGGTRTASITGGYVALALACKTLMQRGVLKKNPMLHPVAAVSCGIVAGEPLLDLDYVEDSGADVDANFVMTGSGQIIEVQMSGEEATFSRTEMDALFGLAEQGVSELIALQKAAIA